MQQATRIPVWRTFLNWIISVIVGSILWPLLTVFFDEHTDADDLGLAILLSIMLSAAASFPAMLILLFTNWQLNKQEMPRQQYLGIHTLVHVGVAILTFFVIYLFVNDGFSRDLFPFLLLAVTYTVVGVTTWLITFSIYRKKQVHRTEQREDILDETNML